MVLITTLIGKRKRRGKNREIRCMKKDLRKEEPTNLPPDLS
jgi:hypothetical protein